MTNSPLIARLLLGLVAVLAALLCLKVKKQLPVPLNVAIALSGGTLATAMTARMGQILFAHLIDPANNNPISGVVLLDRVITWTVFPFAAVVGGMFIGLVMRQVRGWPFLAMAVVTPIWATCLQPEFFDAGRVLQCLVYVSAGVSSAWYVRSLSSVVGDR